jgi:hypothetical protein
MKLRGHHLRVSPALETRENADAAAAGVTDRHDTVFDRDAALALALRPTCPLLRPLLFQHESYLERVHRLRARAYSRQSVPRD